MFFPEFDYLVPESVAEACAMLKEHGSDAVVFSGGTDVIVKMKERVLAPKYLISMKELNDLKNIEEVPGKGIVIGSRVTHNGLVDSDILKAKYPSVCSAANSMANNQVRNRGTIGGNIINATPSADLPPILITLGAYVTLVDVDGSTRDELVEDFITGVGTANIKPTEIMTTITIPEEASKFTGSKYHKFALRKSGALAVVGVAAAVQVEGGIIKDAKIALGAVAVKPVRAKKAEEYLIGKEATDAVYAEAGEIAKTECKPIDDFRASAEYRTAMVSVFTKRSLKSAVENGHN